MNHVARTSGEPGNRRRGAFTVVVLMCLLISTMLLGTLLKIVLLQDRQMGREVVRVQAGWLAESALDRAAARLGVDPEFAGETWEIAADRLGGRESATVTIRVEKLEGHTHQRLIVVEAAYPAQGPDHARVTRQATVTLIQEP